MFLIDMFYTTVSRTRIDTYTQAVTRLITFDFGKILQAYRALKSN